MRSVISVILGGLLVVGLSLTSSGQTLEKRHQIELRVGMWNQTTGVRTETNFQGVTTSVESSGALGGVAYGHWLEETLALTISVTALQADVETHTGTRGVISETVSYTHLRAHET